MDFSIKVNKKGSIVGHTAAIYSLCEGIGDDTVISGAGDKYVVEWNFLNGKQEKFVAHLSSPVFALYHHKTAKQLWIGTANGQVHVIDINSKKEIHAFKAHQSHVFYLEFNSGTGLIYSSGGDGCVCVFDPQNLKLLEIKKFSTSKIRSFAFNEDKIFLAEGNGLSILAKAETLEEILRFQSHNLATNCHLFNPKKNCLMTAGRDAYINGWTLSGNPEKIISIPAHNFAIYKMISLNKFSLFATASRDKNIKIWDY
ncbi:MAG: hypothetical protein ACK452_01705, partial [Bacteroidota bacterium]